MLKEVREEVGHLKARWGEAHGGAFETGDHCGGACDAWEVVPR